MNPSANVAGLAALSICEALLLALNDRNILPEKEIMGILRDAADAHTDAHASASASSDGAQPHAEVAALINKIISGGNSVRRT